MIARIRDRAIAGLARVLVSALFASSEVDRAATAAGALRRGPCLVVANHGNGFVDPVCLTAALGRLPRFLAKSTIFRSPPLRLLLRGLGVVPVHRSADSADTSGNRSSFHQVHRALGKGGTVAMFPEGTVTDEQRLLPLRTGAARLALGALAAGVEDLTILPVGLSYADKVTARSRVLVAVGAPITAAEIRACLEGREPDEEDRAAVGKLTELITAGLRAVSPDFGSLRREAALTHTAELVLRSEAAGARVAARAGGSAGSGRPGAGGGSTGDPSMRELRAVAQALAHLPPEVERAITTRVGRYSLDVTALGLPDHELVHPAPQRALVRRFARRALLLAVILPLTALGAAVNLLPALAVVGIGTLIAEPVTKGTARVLVALVAFPAAWALYLRQVDITGWGVLADLVVLVVSAVLLGVAVQLMVGVVTAGIAWWQIANRRALLPELAQERDEAVAAARRALIEHGRATPGA